MLKCNHCVVALSVLIATGRYAVELGYHTTLLSNAIGAFNMREIEAAVEVNFPAFAHGVLSTAEFIEALAEMPKQ